jgi:hypothetical protein
VNILFLGKTFEYTNEQLLSKMPQDVNFDEEIKEMEVLVFPLNKSKNEEQLVGVNVARNAIVTVGHDFPPSNATGN